MNHTGIELPLMLAKKKPLAMFYCSTFRGREYEGIPEEEFEPYVKSGQFVKDEFTVLASDPEVSVREQLKTGGRAAQEGIDRITGALLGYSEEEIDEYIKQDSLYGNNR